MTVLLRFGHGVFVNALVHEIFGQSILNFGRLDKEAFGKVHIAVVLQHTGIHHLWHIAAVESRKFLIVKSHRNFDCAVAAEVEQNHAVVVVHRADGFSVFDDDECG